MESDTRELRPGTGRVCPLLLGVFVSGAVLRPRDRPSSNTDGSAHHWLGLRD